MRRKRPVSKAATVSGVGVFLLAANMFLLGHLDKEAWADTAQTEVDIRDAITGREIFSEGETAALDLNADGMVNVADSVFLLRTQPQSTPVVSFETSTSQVSEGGGTASVSLTVSTFYQGSVQYGLSGTATDSTDFTAPSGTVQVDGIGADLLIPILDDELLDEYDETESAVETIVLTLFYEEGAGLDYVPGKYIEHTVFVTDNDAIWNGSIDMEGTSVHFSMVIVQGASSLSASLIGDGYGIIPANPPDNTWPCTAVSLNDTQFTASAGPMAIAPALTLTAAELGRSFGFAADEAVEGDMVDGDSLIRGAVSEVLDSPKDQFTVSKVGGFTLVKAIASYDLPYPALEDAPAQKVGQEPRAASTEEDTEL